ncbi:MAG: LamG-like jellyroll fold domain-containing protein [Phycisphaerae bacterium]|jgi:hypothetical protein
MKTFSLLLAICLVLFAHAAVIDDFTDNDLSDYTHTIVLDNGGGSHNGSLWQVSGGQLQISTATYSEIEQSAFVKSGYTLNIGDELRMDYLSNGGNRAMGLYAGVVPEDGVRKNYVTVYSESSTGVFSRGFNGTTEMNLKTGEGNYTKLFIARDGANDYEAGYYAGSVRVVVADRNNLLFGEGDTLAVGFYADVRSTGTIGYADNLEIASISMPPLIVSNPRDVTIWPLESAVFETVFTSGTVPSAEWYKITNAGAQRIEASIPDIDVQLAYDAPANRYTSTLLLNATAVQDSGRYYCQVNNSFDIPALSSAAGLTVCGLIAHWTLDRADYTGSHYTDQVAGNDAIVESVPVFTTGADSSDGGAVDITPDSGWAAVSSGNTLDLPDLFTISCWANRQGLNSGSTNLLVDSGNDNVIEIQDGLQADLWQHICIVFDNAICKLYLDGIPVAESERSLPQGISAELNIGSGAAGSGAFNGCLDDIRIYNYSMNGNEVARLRFDFSQLRSCILPYGSNVDWSGPQDVPDCRVDIYDLASFALAYLSADGTCDLTGPANLPDGQVDMLDFTEVCSAWMYDGLYPSID